VRKNKIFDSIPLFSYKGAGTHQEMSRLKHKRENKAKDPIEKQVVDILEDDDNEFITGVALAADDEQEEPKDPQGEGEKEQEQEVAPAEPEHGKRKRVVRPRLKKRVKKITDINDGKQSVCLRL